MKKKLQFLFSMVALMLVATFAQAQEDVTALYVKNADLSSDVIKTDNGWTCAWRQAYATAPDDSHVNVVEFYAGWGSLEHKEFSVSQNITLPAGDYRIAVNAFYRQGNDGDGTNADRAYIFAGEKKQNVVPFSPGMLNGYSGSNDLLKASNAFYEGQFSNAFDFSVDEDNTTISIGFAGEFNEARCWIALGPVKLYKYSLENYLVDYRAKVAEAEPIVNKKMGTTEKAALDAAIVDESSFSKSSEISAAIATLNTAIINAKKSIADYEELQEALQAGTTIKANSSDATAIETYDAAVADIVAAYEAGTVADFSAAKAVINAALPALAKTQTAPGSDLTPVVTTASWLGAQATPAPFGDGMESYKSGNEGYAPGKVLYQKIEGLIPGIYKVDFYAVANHAREGSAFGDGIAQLYANATTEDITVIDQDWCTLADYPRTLTTKVFSDGVLEYGIQNVAQGGQWYVAKASKLTFVEPISTYAVSIAEGIVNGTVEAAPAKACADETVKLTITPADGYELDELTVMNGETPVTVTDNTFVMPAAAVTVSATFKEKAVATTYAVNIAEGLTNGSVEATPATAAEGETVKLTITPADGYELDELTVMAGETPVTVAEGYTFEMPASAVTVSATFKEIAIEPEIPSVTATLVHTAGTGWGSNTGKNTVDGAAEYYNNEAGSGWAGAAFAEFGFELPNGATITKATLTWNATNGNNKDNRNNKIYYLNEGQTVDYEAITTSEPALLYTDAKTYITNVPYTKGNPSAISDETDVTDAVKSLAAQKSIIFQWTGNGGGATLAGKASENAPKLVIEYIPGAPELANATFDANAEDVVTVTLQGYQRNVAGDQKAGMQPVTGWTPGTQTESDPGYCGGVFAYGSTNKLNNKVEAPATAPEGSESASALGLSAVWAGVAQYTQEVTLPAGDYKFTYTVFNGANEGAVTKNLFGFRASGGTEYFSEQKTFTVGKWATYEVTFTLDQETSGNISVGFIGSGGSGNAPHLFVDNVTLTKIPGVELALIDLQKSLEAATDVKAKYVVGDGLFQYAASEIEPLTNAITTAQAAYNAAESKDAVNSAKETLDAFVSTFAPVMNTPEAEKLYTLQNKQASEQALEGEEVANHYLTLSAEGIGIATTPQALKFEAAEGGKFYITDGEYYVGLAGTDDWSMSSAADKKEALTISATLVGEAVYYTLGESKGMVGADYPKKENKGCWANKGAGDGDAVLWTIAEYVEPTDPNDYTNMIVNADLKGEGGFDATGTKGIDGSGIVKASTQAEFDFKQTIANLPAGQYKLTAQAAYRYGGDEAAEAAAIAGGTETKLVQLYATVGETTVATPVQNRYDGASETDYANGEGSVVVNEKYVPNSSSAVKAWFAAGQYVNEVIFNIAEAGDVTIGINRTGTPESDYTVIGPWTLYRLGDAVVPNPTYEIAIKGGIENGTVEADATEAEAGATVKLTITPAEGYELKSISISYGEDEDAKTIEPDEENSFIMPAAPVVIDAVFSEIIPDIVLSAPTFNMESGTQNEPSLYPAGTALKVTYTAENLEANGLTADDVQVKILVMLSGDLPEESMNMQSETKHSIMPPQTFYIPLGETDFPEALKNGYVYQSINILSAELVKPATETEPEETLAAYVGAPVSLRWVGLEAEEEEIDPNLIEIAQSQSPQISDGATRATVVEGDGYTQYTTDGGVCVIVKMYDVDVTGCDYVVIKFAEPIPSGINAAFWAQGSLDNIGLDAGITEYKYVFANDTKCAIQNGILPQITLLTLWNAQTVKISGIYKHLDEEGQVQINDIDAAKAKRNGKFYKKGQFVILNEGKAFSLNGIETK